MLLDDPDLATWQDVEVSVTTTGREAGRIVRMEGGRIVRAATAADGPRALDSIVAALARASSG